MDAKQTGPLDSDAASSGAGRWLALLVVALGAAGLWHSQQRESISYDEVELIYSGVRSLRLADYSVSPHPPLTKLLAGLAVLPLRPALPPDPVGDGPDRPGARSAWIPGKMFVFGRPQPPAGRFEQPADALQLISWARVPSLLMWLVLVLAIHGWSRELYGAAAGWLSLLLAVSCPISLTAGQAVTTDIAGAAFGTLGLWLLSRALARPCWQRELLAGLALGLAVGSRFQGVAVAGLGLVIAAILRWLRPRDEAPPLEPRPAGLLASLGGSLRVGLLLLLVLAGLYRVVHVGHFLAGIQLLRSTISPDAGGAPFFLDGVASPSGWYRYFPQVCAYKLPPGHLTLMLALLASPLWRRLRRPEWLAAGPALFVFLFAIQSRINYGIRHLLPALVLGYVLAGRLLADDRRGARAPLALTLLLLGLAGWSVAERVRVHPHYLPYVSPWFGGAERGYKLMADSNVDSGQGLRYLAEDAELMEHGVLLAYFGNGDLQTYGVRYRYLAGYHDQHRLDEETRDVPYPPRFLAISATFTHLYGLTNRPGSFGWLLETPPDRRPCPSILVWDLQRRPGWLAHLAVVGVEVELSPQWSAAQKTQLQARSLRLLRRLAARRPELAGEVLPHLGERIRALGPFWGAGVGINVASLMHRAGLREVAVEILEGLLSGRWVTVSPETVPTIRTNLRLARGG